MSRRLGLIPALLVAAMPVSGQEMPSGQNVELREVLVEEVEAETWFRFRFLAPAIARDAEQVEFEAVEADLSFACSELALPYLAERGLTGQVVVVTLQDRPVAFGSSDPDATQFIDAFRIESGTCIWEEF